MCRILCSAVKHKGRVYTNDFEMVSHRDIESRHNLPSSTYEFRGFLTDDRDFVDRLEAWDLAKAAGQVDVHYYRPSFGLSSEDFTFGSGRL